MTDIGIRLKEFRIRTNIKMPAIAALTGISKETLYKWEKGTKPSNISDYFKLKGYLDKMESKLEVETFEIESQKPVTLGLPLNNAHSAVSQTDGKAASGTIIFTNNGPELIVDRINAPFLGRVDGVIEVIGFSMDPTFGNGCLLAITRVSDNQRLNWGQYYYIIDTNWQGIIRRVYQGNKENTLILISDNPDQSKYPPIEINLDQVEAIFKVCASITKF